MRQALLPALLCAALITSVSTPALGFSLFGNDSGPRTLQTEKATLTLAPVAEDLEHPWGLAFLPGGRLLVTERAGRLRYVGTDGKKSAPLEGLPAIRVDGQGGLLDLVLDPDFTSNRRIYFSFNEPGADGSGTAVARAILGEQSLQQVEVIFRQQPKVKSGHHLGGRLVFGRDGQLFVTLGDRGGFRDSAQTLDTHIGKIIRIRPDGSVPADNPYVNTPGALDVVWSYGHRNIQGAALHPQTGLLWTHEHGPRGGDEINIARPGLNYGWPVITYGVEYTGGRIGPPGKEGMEQPLHYWVPSIAPSGMAFYTGALIPAWQNHLLVGALKFQQLVRLELDGEQVRHEERIDIGRRVRDVKQGPDGAIYLLTDHPDGEILRLSPDGRN